MCCIALDTKKSPSSTPGALDQNTNQSRVPNAYAHHPMQLATMAANGAALIDEKSPLARGEFLDFRFAEA